MTPAVKTQPVPRRASTIAMWLFLSSLAMLFFASMVGYVVIRVSNGTASSGPISLPAPLWVSTLMMLASSYTMERALRAIRREKQALFRTYLSATIVFATVFVLIQTPAMFKLFRDHQQATADYQTQQMNMQPAVSDSSINGDEVIAGRRSIPFYGLVMVLILVHALHVLGGMIALAIVAWHGYQGRYDHEHFVGVNHCVLYWHFLDGVWLVMFVVITAFR